MYREAMEAYKQVIRIEPDDANAHGGLGAIYVILNDIGSALVQYNILKDLDPEMAKDLFSIIHE